MRIRYRVVETERLESPCRRQREQLFAPRSHHPSTPSSAALDVDLFFQLSDLLADELEPGVI